MTKLAIFFINKIWDKLGICTSTLCLFHCLATPILLLAFPATQFEFLNDHMIHEIFAIVIVISLMLAIYPTCKEHGHIDIIVIATIGVAFILASVFLDDYITGMLHTTFTIFGSIFLITAHLKNMKVRHGRCNVKTSCSGHKHH